MAQKMKMGINEYGGMLYLSELGFAGLVNYYLEDVNIF